MKKLIVLLSFFSFLFIVSCNEELPIEQNLDQGKSLQKSLMLNNSFILISNANNLPKNLEQEIKSLNGIVKTAIPEIGLAFVSSDDPNFVSKASKISGVRSIVPDLTRQWIDPNIRKVNLGTDFGNPPESGDDDLLFDLQWGHDAVNAPEAWDITKGAGVRVAVLDDGIDSDHPDLAPNLNIELSTSFISGETFEYSIPGDPFSHGSHTSGTIGAADNAVGTIGIAPECELVMVKVLSSYTGSGSFSAIINGIYYAAIIDADIINMSLGATLEKSGNVEEGYTAKDVAELKNALGRAVTFAYQNGTIVITSAGNESTDYDHSADLIHLPSGVQHTLSISATAPLGWGIDPETNLDEFAPYSNSGQSAIDFAAPGGYWGYYFIDPSSVSTVAGITRPTYVFDYVFSTGSDGRYYWSTGTSMAAPHVAGVAALIISKNGGSMKPAQVEAVLRASADDLGKPGNDDFYGGGRVNAYRAVTE